MAYEAKTNWKLDDRVMPDDMSRIEQGIKDVETKTTESTDEALSQAKSYTDTKYIQSTNYSDNVLAQAKAYTDSLIGDALNGSY